MKEGLLKKVGTSIDGKLSKPSQLITDDEKWLAVVECVKEFDGIFFYGVKTTGVFCRPSCRAKTPVRVNVEFFDDADAAAHAGFRPCKKCRPDMDKYDPDMELVSKAKEFMDVSYQDDVDFTMISKQLGVSTNHLARIFKQIEGTTPAKYVNEIRVDKALEHMGQGASDILDIAGLTGFKSLSVFYRSFKDKTGYAPGEYRKIRGR